MRHISVTKAVYSLFVFELVNRYFIFYYLEIYVIYIGWLQAFPPSFMVLFCFAICG